MAVFTHRAGSAGKNSAAATPAIAAEVTERLWEIGDTVNVLEAWEAAN